MKERHETEIKLEVSNPRSLKRRLAELGFHAIQRCHFESNYLFDFPDLRLRQARCLLRVRLVDGRGLLTFKGAPLGERHYKVRREAETTVEDSHRLREILACLGLREVFRYEKYRTVYSQQGKAGAAHLVYDETPIGNYLELEGPKRWIDRVARQLGYARTEYITASYASLYYQKCLERGEKPGHMIFPARKS